MRPVQRQKSDGTALFDKERFKKHCMNFRLAAGSRLFSRRQSDRAVFTNEPWANLQPVSGRREWSHSTTRQDRPFSGLFRQKSTKRSRRTEERRVGKGRD